MVRFLSRTSVHVMLRFLQRPAGEVREDVRSTDSVEEAEMLRVDLKLLGCLVFVGGLVLVLLVVFV